jgi:hypothetical protein
MSYGWKYFELKSKTAIKEEEAKEHQMKEGYDPRGYGFYSFKLTYSNGEYTAKWQCSASCE